MEITPPRKDEDYIQVKRANGWAPRKANPTSRQTKTRATDEIDPVRKQLFSGELTCPQTKT